jgi:hypothetical protein
MQFCLPNVHYTTLHCYIVLDSASMAVAIAQLLMHHTKLAMMMLAMPVHMSNATAIAILYTNHR